MKRLLAILILVPALACAQNMGAFMMDEASVQTTGEAAPTAQANLVGWWRFSATDTGASVADASGHGNAMIQGTGSAQPTVASGYGSFDGGDYLSVTNTTLLDGSAGYTVTAWINVSSWVNYMGIMWVRGTQTYGLTTDTSATKKLYCGRGSSTLISTNAVGTGWVFVAAGASRLSGANTATVRIGAAATDSTAGFAAVMWINDAWRIGWDDLNAAYKFNGLMDDVRLYNKQLSASELNAVEAEGRR